MKIKEPKNCLYCNKLFIYNQSEKQKFCNQSCHSSYSNKNRVWKEESKLKISNSARAKYQGENNPNYRGGGLTFICTNCNVEFRVAKGQFDAGKHSGKYCSTECRYSHKASICVSRTQTKINKMFRCNLSRALRNKEFNNSVIFNYVNYSLQELKDHLEKQFTKGMTWENNSTYGWHIDHKKPMSYFKFESYTDEEFKQCWALENLQPLWRNDNLSKGGKNTKINQKKYGIK